MPARLFDLSFGQTAPRQERGPGGESVIITRFAKLHSPSKHSTANVLCLKYLAIHLWFKLRTTPFARND
jgi:hypothetical protein